MPKASTHRDIINPMKRPQYLNSLIKNPSNTSYEGKDRDEEVLLLIRRSLITNFTWLFGGIIYFIVPFITIPLLRRAAYENSAVFDNFFIFSLTFFWYLSLFGYLLREFLDWYFEVFLVTTKKIIDIDKGATNISETLLTNVQDVTSETPSMFAQIFNIGNIKIQTAAETKEFEFGMVDNPSKVRDFISDTVARKDQTSHGIN